MSTTDVQIDDFVRQRELAEDFVRVRALTARLIKPLGPEDCAVQSMSDVSPARWHLAHTTWFFEAFVLAHDSDYRDFDPAYAPLYNSYYETLGMPFPRSRRGMLSRPDLITIEAYRSYVEQHILRLLQGPARLSTELLNVVELGLHHEQQHQELILTDIKHVLSCNPLYPAYRDGDLSFQATAREDRHWCEIEEGLRWIGHDGQGFAYDNEAPRHREFLETFGLENQLVNCGEYLKFIDDDGYRRPELWLSLGWNCANQQSWDAPLYWIQRDGRWLEFTLAGLRALDMSRPVCHVSYFEADAFARWSGSRLPTEAEWETAAENVELDGNFADKLLDRGDEIHPQIAHGEADGARQMFGDAWEWTASSYAPYPGYSPPAGTLGEYNGKFMCNQYVLRGGSCATPQGHIRRTYRNFFPPDARWQFSGIRLAQDRC